MTTPDHTTTTLDTVVVEKAKLLDTLRENRAKHAEIYEAACAGYWVKTKDTLENQKASFEKMTGQTQQEFSEWLAEASAAFDKQYAAFLTAVDAKDRDKLQPFDTAKSSNSWSLIRGAHWTPELPTHHLEDYDRTIKMLEFSVADRVQLSLSNFSAYVQNDWSWQKAFVTSNQGYLQCVTGSMFSTIGDSFLTSAAYTCAMSGYAGAVSR